MLTLQDCYGCASIEPRLVDLIAHHEHLTEVVAIEKAEAFLSEDWGGAAVVQMVRDEAALPERALADALALAERLYGGGPDRRSNHR